MRLGEIIKVEREVKGISVSELSKQTSIPESVILRIEQDPEYTNTPHGLLQAKALMNFLNIDHSYIPKQEELPIKPPKSKPYILQYLVNGLILVLFFVFVYANAVYKGSVNVQVNQSSSPSFQQTSEESSSYVFEKVITLKSEGDVWITAIVDGEKSIFNIKEGEIKTIRFQNKVAFETIGNANQLVMVLNGQEVSLDREIVHNVFVDEEGIFYNGYNILRGKPKI